MIADYLKEHQPYFYNLLKKSFQTDRINHAVLLVGDADDAALFLAQSLICEEGLLACEECSRCLRIKNNQYPDFIMFDGNEESIKKGNIEYIQREFSKSALEGSRKVYLLKHIDHSTDVAMNSLLKFLEEPVDQVYAIMTTQNLNKVLPTIQSRCQIIHMLPESKSMLIERLKNQSIDQEDATILASLFNNYNECLSFYNDDHYQSIKENVIHFIEDYYNSPNTLLINQQLQITNKYKGDRQLIACYLNMLVLGLRDVFHVKHEVHLTFTNHEMFFKKLPNDDRILDKIEIILDTLPSVETSGNLALAIDGMVYKLLEGVTHG